MSDRHHPSSRLAILLAVGGMAVAFGGAVSYFLVFAQIPALRDVPWVNLPLAALGVAIAAWGTWAAFRAGAGWVGRITSLVSVALAVLFAGFLAMYVFSLSYDVPEPTDVARSMTIAPDVTMTDVDGRPVSIGDFRGRKLLVVFYRGFW